jgi:hypothetical protein
VLAAFVLAIHAPLRAFTGRPLMSACHTLSAGRIGQLGAAGGALAHTGDAAAVSTAAEARARRFRMVTSSAPGAAWL